jgi:hypothetical protein
VYAVIRRYAGMTSVDEVVHRIEAGWLPQIKVMPGFVAYYVLDAGNGTAASISLFENEGGAAESSRRAVDWLRESIGALAPNPPEITAGAVRISLTRQPSPI